MAVMRGWIACSEASRAWARNVDRASPPSKCIRCLGAAVMLNGRRLRETRDCRDPHRAGSTRPPQAGAARGPSEFCVSRGLLLAGSEMLLIAEPEHGHRLDQPPRLLTE